MIDILMATYNGEKYIGTQISSIVNQTYTDWQLLVHDDGSTDGTVSIIKKWAEIDNRIKLIDDGIVLHHPGKNFIHVLQQSYSEYACFADQDDYWFENKLEVMLKYFTNTEVPKLVYSSCYIWKFKNYDISRLIRFNYSTTLNEFLFLNGGIQGCAMMFNGALRDILRNYNANYIYMHDHLASLAAYCFGDIEFINIPLFLYRQHDKNASLHVETSRQTIIKNIVFQNKNPVVCKCSYEGISLFLRNYIMTVPEEKKKIINQYLDFMHMKPFKRFFSIALSKFSLGYRGHCKLVLKLLLRPYYR